MAIKDIVLPTGKTIQIDEWLHWPLYSTVEFASTVSPNLRAFSYVRGQRVPSQGLATRLANETDTNMNQRQQMAYDEKFIMYALTFEPFALTDSGDPDATAGQPLEAEAPSLSALNLRRLQRDVEVELFLGAGQRKPQLRYTMSYVPQSVGATAWTNGDSPTPAAVLPQAINYGTSGSIHPMNQRRLELPIVIESERQMYLRLYNPNGVVTDLDQNVRLRFWLDGMKRRPVG